MRLDRPFLPAILRLIAAATLLAAWPALLHAQCANQALPAVSPWNPAAPFQRLAVLELAGCLGGPVDATAIAKQVHTGLAIKPADSDRMRPAAANALQLVSGHVDSLNTSPPKDVLRELVQQLGLAHSLLGSGQSPALPTAWVLDQGRVPVLALDLQASLTLACKESTSPCPEQFELVKEVLRVVRLAKTALDVSESPVMRKHLEVNARRERMWNAYFTEARSQYLWELALNGWRMPDTRESVNGVKTGFREVPTNQILLLHPTVAFEYADSEPDGNRFKGVAVVDVIGYNTWRWKEDGSMGTAWGGSVVVTLGDQVERNAVGYGLMLHVDHRWSIGATWASGKVAFVASGDVAQLWTRVSSLRKRQIMTGQ